MFIHPETKLQLKKCTETFRSNQLPDFKKFLNRNNFNILETVIVRPDLITNLVHTYDIQNMIRQEVFRKYKERPYPNNLFGFYKALHKVFVSKGKTGLPESVFPYLIRDIAPSNPIRLAYSSFVKAKSAKAYLDKIEYFISVSEIESVTGLKCIKGYQPAINVFRKTLECKHWKRIFKEITPENFDTVCPLDEWQFVLLFKSSFYQKCIREGASVSPELVKFLENRILKTSFNRTPSLNLKKALKRLKELDNAISIYKL